MKKQNHFNPAIRCGNPSLLGGSLQYDLLYVSSPKESVHALKETAVRCRLFQERAEEITALAVCHNPCVECRSITLQVTSSRGMLMLLSQLQMCWVFGKLVKLSINPQMEEHLSSPIEVFLLSGARVI